MRWVTLSAARTSTAALLGMCIVTIATHATEPAQWQPPTMRTGTTSAVLRDYQLRDVKPCLIGLGTCPSTYPPPTPCLVSTARCWADARPQLASAEGAEEGRFP
jgi:hypothetical protein